MLAPVATVSALWLDPMDARASDRRWIEAAEEMKKQALSESGARVVEGALLYSTSRPCSSCEQAAAKAGVRRMYFGPQAQDGGQPKSG